MAHLSDPWARNPVAKLSKLHFAMNRGLESRTLSLASLVTVPTREVGELLSVPEEKIRLIPHCFVPEWYPNRHSEPQINVVRHLGSLGMGRSVDPLIRALKVFTRRGGQLANTELEFIGDSPETHELESLRNLLPTAVIESRIPYLQSLELMGGSSGLLLVEGSYGNSPFLPSKLVDYLGSGRPILGISPDGPSVQLLKSTDNFRLSPTESSSNSEELERFLKSMRNSPRRNPAEDFCCERVTNDMDLLLDELVGC
jgi:hypothetical protein